MSKQTLYTAMGIALSLIVAIGGWMLTSMLIDKKSDALLSATGIVHINVPSAAVTNDTDNVPLTSEINDERPKLTEREIVSILQNWDTPGRERPHEPTDGQLSMEQAINAGKAGLTYFCEQGTIPAELMGYEYDKINAYLYDNQTSGRETQSLDPFYSYWEISLTSESMNVALTINAVTGEIWKAEIVSILPGISFNEVDAEHILNTFISYLDLGTGDSFEVDGTKVSRSFDGGILNAVVQKRGVQINNEPTSTMVYIYLSAKM